MRYILNSSGFIEAISFSNELECNNKTCVEYKGSIPSGYGSLAEWSETANINAYKIVDGNLTFDSTENTRLQNLWKSQQEEASKTLTLDMVYPVGSIYLSVNNTNPSTIFGFGTWVKESGGYLYGCVNTVSNSTYTGLNTQSGGSGTSGSTTLTADQSGLPSHTHTITDEFNAGLVAMRDGAGDSSWSVYVNNSASGNWSYRRVTAIRGISATGGTDAKSGHTHSTPSHTHNVAYIGVFIWRRVS